MAPKLWLLPLVPLACAHAGSAGAPADAAYDAALAQATTSRQLYRGFDRVVDAVATMETQAFLAAKARREGELSGLTGAEPLPDGGPAAQGLSFELGLVVDPVAQNDLDEPGTVWRVQLLLPDGSALAPTDIIGRHVPDPNERLLFPYLKHFWVAYTVRFPAPPAGTTGPLTLRLASAVGLVDLAFPASP
ncbi:MAG: hypothetical protein ACYCWW_03195 [Deltaproteobacteria bacterium]